MSIELPNGITPTNLTSSSRCTTTASVAMTRGKSNNITTVTPPTASSSSLSSPSKKPKTPYRKILYEEQKDYEDNHTGPEFLAEIVQNAHVQPYDYWMCVVESCAFSQQLSLIVLYSLSFKHMVFNLVPIDFIITLECILLLNGYLVFYYLASTKSMLLQMKSVIVIIMVLLGLSPVLRTLTMAYSTDTIYALVFLLFCLHVFTHDYAYVNGYTENFEAALSLNSIFFISILFASRLPTPLHSFAIIAFAVELFAMLPILRHHLRRWSEDLNIIFTWFLFCISCCLLLPHSAPLTCLYMLGTAFIIFGAPLWLIYVQQFKDEIQGPWDEARISPQLITTDKD